LHANSYMITLPRMCTNAPLKVVRQIVRDEVQPRTLFPEDGFLTPVGQGIVQRVPDAPQKRKVVVPREEVVPCVLFSADGFSTPVGQGIARRTPGAPSKPKRLRF
jgi:archaeosine-15-forming tRNA-guanine transglycosylase